MKARITVVDGARPTEVRLRLPTVIGRSQEAKIKVRHALVSRRHCELVDFEGLLCVKDLGSANGTYVNGERISAELFALRDGDLLRVGNVTFQVSGTHLEVPTGEVAALESTTRLPPRDAQSPTAGIANDSTIQEKTPFVEYHETSGGSFVGIVDADLPKDEPLPPDDRALGDFLRDLE